MTIKTLTSVEVVKQIKADPFFYGWRYVLRPLPNGDFYREQVPLTLEDILHPEEDDFRVHALEHEDICAYLYGVFKAQVAPDPHAIVMYDVRVAWANRTVRPHTPDVSVVFGVKQYKNWSTFDEQIEGTKPSLIVEVTSPSTRQIDLIDKFDQYDLVGVPYYIMIDLTPRVDTVEYRILGYESGPKGYVNMIPNQQGWLWLPPLKVWLGLEGQVPRCYDAAGQKLGDYTQLHTALLEAKEVISTTETQLKAETKARVEAEQRTQIETKARVEAEQRTQASEARLRDLEAELRRLRGE